ncbi:TetR family transcriptional regulator [Streptomyces sp. NPDC127172]|uniref:TetR family transcriptional regulator n=1 Tax=Streptomyces sp. NPDC127172 TaxID=3345382 RepID=UPI0036276B74
MTSTSRTGQRRWPAVERRAEILRAADVIAVSEGLDKLTAQRVAQAAGVVPGLVDHHFKSAGGDVVRVPTVAPSGGRGVAIATTARRSLGP